MKTLTTALATATVAALLTAAPAGASDPQPPSRPGSVHVFVGRADNPVRLGWTAPARAGSNPIRRYLITWTGGRLVVPATVEETVVTGLDTGRYVFRVKAVSRAGAGPWSKSSAVYVR